jgi:hypothetical protein
MTKPAPLLISSAADMLKKAHSDLEVLRVRLDAYTVFNFFVTCYHIMDYIKATGTVAESEIEEFYRDQDFDLARFLCNRGKHLELKPANRKATRQVFMGAVAGIARSGLVRSGEPLRCRLSVEGTEVLPVQVAERLLRKWEEFFDRNKVPRFK